MVELFGFVNKNLYFLQACSWQFSKSTHFATLVACYCHQWLVLHLIQIVVPFPCPRYSFACSILFKTELFFQLCVHHICISLAFGFWHAFCLLFISCMWACHWVFILLHTTDKTLEKHRNININNPMSTRPTLTISTRTDTSTLWRMTTPGSYCPRYLDRRKKIFMEVSWALLLWLNLQIWRGSSIPARAYSPLLFPGSAMTFLKKCNNGQVDEPTQLLGITASSWSIQKSIFHVFQLM